jgi:phosphohistidine phosphatase SixA/ADP-ribose pyrophosphatase YjhB (NUDIX family)
VSNAHSPASGAQPGGSGTDDPGDGLRISAGGGVLWRPALGHGNPLDPNPGVSGPPIELAMVHRPRYDDWSLPKGKLHGGEHPLLGAVREVMEETAIEPVVGRRLPQQEYRLGPDRKTVDYWAMTPRAIGAAGFTPNDEVDELRWVRPAEAGTWLSYDRDRELIRAFLAVPPAEAATLLLVRHARAGDRSAWRGDDDLRPLEEAGRAQAARLRDGLRWFWPERVLSADILRCVDTVRPVAEELGLPVEPEPALTERAFDADEDRTLRRVKELVALGGRSVLCSQGGVIPAVVRTLARASGLHLRHVRARKGSVWALSFVDDRLTAADYYPDLAG